MTFNRVVGYAAVVAGLLAAAAFLVRSPSLWPFSVAALLLFVGGLAAIATAEGWFRRPAS